MKPNNSFYGELDATGWSCDRIFNDPRISRREGRACYMFRNEDTSTEILIVYPSHPNNSAMLIIGDETVSADCALSEVIDTLEEKGFSDVAHAACSRALTGHDFRRNGRLVRFSGPDGSCLSYWTERERYYLLPEMSDRGNAMVRVQTLYELIGSCEIDVKLSTLDGFEYELPALSRLPNLPDGWLAKVIEEYGPTTVMAWIADEPDEEILEDEVSYKVSAWCDAYADSGEELTEERAEFLLRSKGAIR